MAVRANSTTASALPLLRAKASPRARLLPGAEPRERLGLGALASRRITLKHALEVSAFASLLTAWAVGYTLICPTQPIHNAVQHVAQVRP